MFVVKELRSKVGDFMERKVLAENLLTFMPMLFKKLMKGMPDSVVPKLQIQLLHFISAHNEKPMSWYSEKMMVPKPNITVLADKLINEGFIERGFDSTDRRIIILKITSKGQEFIEKHKEIVKEVMIRKFEKLSDNEVKKLLELFSEIKDILNKIE